MESPSSCGGAILAHAGGEAGGDKRGDVSGVAEGGSSGAKGVVYSRDGYANWCHLLPQSLLNELIRHPMAKRMQALPAPLGAAGAGRTTPPPPPEADIVAPPLPPPPQASARKICNFACSKVKSITQTEERFAFDDPGLPAGRPAGEALKIRLPGGGALLLCVLPGATADAVMRRAAAACGLAPSQLALFCGGRRLGGPAPLSRAGGVRSGGTLRVVQRLAGGGAGAGRMRGAPKTKQAAAARLATEQAAAEEAVRMAAEEAACLATEQAAAEEPARVAAGRPPHLPPAREVKVDEDKMAMWKRFGGTELEAVLKSGAVALLDAKWVIARAASGGVLLPRQALSDEAFLSLTEIQARTSNFDLSVVCVSHCWLQPDHPDPRGCNLRAVARALASLTSKGEPTGVFLDFCSIHQNCRDVDGAPQDTAFAWLGSEERFADGAVGRFPAEDILFKQALGSLGIFFAHPGTHVLMLTAFPPDYFTATYERSGNVKPYFERGWCFCEASWAMMVKNFYLVLDLGKDTGEGKFDEEKCRQGRKAPVLPEEFVAQLQSKGFTNGSTDSPLVADLYSKGFKERFGVATRLFYASLGWGDEEARAVARMLPHAPKLESLNLDDNSIGDEGARALAKALPRAPGLESLWLSNNSIGDEGARALAEALPHAPKLDSLWLLNNSIGDECARALAKVLPHAPKLKVLNLSNNSIGDEAKAALRTSWGVRGGSLII